jgi:uncharacterized SAM-binding protein YcdF (DUF218 family)
VASLVLVFGVLYLGRTCWLTEAAAFLDVAEPPRAVDYVQVLGGGDDTRPFVAATLYKKGWARQVLFAPPRPSLAVRNGEVPAEQEIIRRVLVARGVPAQALVLLGGEADSTRDEAAALAQFLESRPDRSVAVVTNAFHTRRARSIFRKVLGERAAQVFFVAAPVDGFNGHDWWCYEAGLRTYADEYIKWAFYSLRY